jgi:hypothetical protein
VKGKGRGGGEVDARGGGKGLTQTKSPNGASHSCTETRKKQGRQVLLQTGSHVQRHNERIREVVLAPAILEKEGNTEKKMQRQHNQDTSTHFLTQHHPDTAHACVREGRSAPQRRNTQCCSW